MLTFKQFIEHSTNNGRYSWFYMSKHLVETLTPEERSQIIVEGSNDTKLVRIWDRDKYLSQASKENLEVLMGNAIVAEDFELVKQIKERISNANTKQ